MTQFLPYVVVGLVSGSVYGLAGTGLVLTYKTSGIFNFAYGTIAAAMAYAFYDLRERNHLPWPLALVICVFVISPLAGLLLERMARRLGDAPVAMKIVATVGLIIGLQQVTILRYGAATIRPAPFLPTSTFRFMGVNVGIDQAVIVGVVLAATVALTRFFAITRLGRGMRAVVDNADLLALTGVSPTAVRRSAWYVGTAFVGLSGILVAPTIGLDVNVLTLLVVSAFGAAAVGLFTSIPLTYAGGLGIGVVASLTTKYATSGAFLHGLPPSLPFIALFVVLVAVPRRWLVDFAPERKIAVVERRRVPPVARLAGIGVLAITLVRLPDVVHTHLADYTTGLVYVILFLSLTLLMHTSGQVSLAQLAFAAVGAVTSGRLASEAHIPWLIAALLGGLVAVPVGAVLAIPAIRRSGLYLALATYGFAVLLEQLVYTSRIMFGHSVTALPAPRPSIATGDKAYFYLVLAFVVAGVALVVAIDRSRLGRLLRAMADSAVALNTYGTNVTALKVVVFCISAFLAGIAGALLGPATGSTGPPSFTSFASLLLVVVLAIVPGGAVARAIAAAIALAVVPGYLPSVTAHQYLNLLFGATAVAWAMGHAGLRAPVALARLAANTRRYPTRSPAKARVAELRLRQAGEVV